jgi:hypothetical protein
METSNMAAQSFGNRAQYITSATSPDRQVGYFLALGIFIAPYIFGWFVLRAGYSTLARALAFGWCLIVLTAAFSMHSTDQVPASLSGLKKVAADNAISEVEAA